MALLIKNAHVYTPADAGIKDVLIVNDRVAAVDDNLTVTMPDLATLDAKGLILTPGFIDQHIHVTGGGGEGGPKTRTWVFPVLTAPPAPFRIFLRRSGRLKPKGFLRGCTRVTTPILRQP